MAAVTFFFQNYLREMLKKDGGNGLSFMHHFERKASIKDVIESLGVPHPLIDKLTVNGTEVGFDYILQDKDIVEVTPLTPPINPFIPTILRPQALDRIAFVVDVNVGKLAMHLRMLGFDTVYGITNRDGKLAVIASTEKRILLTRDISLLKRKIVMHGYLLRAHDPTRQLIEVVRLYDLSGKIKPLNRCIPCNGLLRPVDKETILDRLEPLTRKYFESFHICDKCNKIYWAGSHQEKIISFVQEVLEAVSQDESQDT